MKLLHSVENIVLPVKDYINLLNYNELAKQKLGIDEVSRQIREARWTQDNLRISSLTSMLFKTQIYYDNLGNLLPSSTGAQTTVNYAVPAGNQNQLDVFGTGNPILSAPWSTATTTIDKQIQALHQAAVELTGYELKHAFYGKNVPSYLTSNTNLGNYFFRDSYGPDAFGPQYIATADIPNPVAGFDVAQGVSELLHGSERQSPDARRRRSGRLHAGAEHGLDRVPGRDLSGSDQGWNHYAGRADRCVEHGDARRHVRLRHGQRRSADGEDRLWRHVPAGAESSQRDLRRDGEVLGKIASCELHVHYHCFS